MRTLSQDEIDQVSGGVGAGIGAGELGEPLRGYRIPGGGRYDDSATLDKSLAKKWTAGISFASDFSQTTAMS